MALTVLIDGVDQTARYRDGSLQGRKVLASEQATLEILDDDSTAGAYRPVADQEVVIYDTGDLLMGGPIVLTEGARIVSDQGAATRITVRDYLYWLEGIFVGRRIFPSQDALTLFDALVTEFLAARGFTNLSATSGGPILPEITIDEPDYSLALLWQQISDECRALTDAEWQHRINGLKQCALVEPGTLIWPFGSLSETNSTVLDFAPELSTVTQEGMRQANRLFLRTGTPDAGPGPVEHVEHRTADGVQVAFPVNVLPTAIDGSAQAAASASDVSLSVHRLPASASIRVGGRLRIDKHTTVYEVSASTTTNSAGEVTVGLSAGLERDVEEGDAVTFLPDAFVQLELDTVVTPMAGSPWVWDRDTEAMVNPSAAPADGVDVAYRTWITFPAWVRVWETSDPPVQTAIGGFDRSILIDGTISGEEQTNVVAAAAYGRAQLARRNVAPRRFTIATHERGLYPLLTVSDVDFPGRLIEGAWIVEEVAYRDISIDPTTTDEAIRYEATLTDGVLSRTHVEKLRGTRTGLRFGETLFPVTLHVVDVPGSTGTQTITGAVATPAVLLSLTGVLDTGTTGSNVSLGFGATDSDLAGQNAMGVMSRDNVGTTATRQGQRTDGTGIVYAVQPAATSGVDQDASVDSLDANGFTLDWLEVGGGGQVAFIAIPTDIIEESRRGKFTARTSAGTTDVTWTPGWEPDVIIFWAPRFNTSDNQAPPATGNAIPYIGFAVNGGAQGCVSAYIEHNAAATNTAMHMNDTSALSPIESFTAAVSFLSNGFRLTYSGGAGAAYAFRYLAIKGGVWRGGFGQAPTSPGTQALDVTGMASPYAVIAAGIASTTINANSNSLGLTVGMAARGAAQQYAVWNSDVDPADPTQADRAVMDDLLYFGTGNAPATVAARADVQAWSAEAITLDWPVASAAFRYLWLAVGE